MIKIFQKLSFFSNKVIYFTTAFNSFLLITKKQMGFLQQQNVTMTIYLKKSYACFALEIDIYISLSHYLTKHL